MRDHRTTMTTSHSDGPPSGDRLLWLIEARIGVPAPGLSRHGLRRRRADQKIRPAKRSRRKWPRGITSTPSK
jgi:hypothetical protein